MSGTILSAIFSDESSLQNTNGEGQGIPSNVTRLSSQDTNQGNINKQVSYMLTKDNVDRKDLTKIICIFFN